MFNLPVIDMVATGKNIIKLRKAAGMSVSDIQMAFGFSTPQAIYKWQRGEALPSMDNMVALSWLFDVSIEDILIVEDPVGIKKTA